ncbi:MAG: DUF1634 domain-containing protein [Chloroflexi bacterium]|nr:DUF1634 domain-containing protein [Chloroflexota bacterium]
MILRTGTLLAVAMVSAGFVLSLAAGGEGPGARPIGDLLAVGGADALTTAGLLALTMLPLAVLVVAAVTFAAERERRYLLSSLATLALLVAGLVATALLTAS